MAHSAHKTKDEVRELFDPEDELEAKLDELASLIRASTSFSVFTGAGISTSAGISDFRGPNGVWTLRAQGKAPARGVSTSKAIPTPTHMALVALEREGILKTVISQNCDGLHRKSGISPGRIAELHGNTNLESCAKCGRQYMRDFRTRRASNSVHQHETGRRCDDDKCNGKLRDSIINFGENLPEGPLDLGEVTASTSDLMLVLGSSLRVTPAANMPELVGTRPDARLVIVNLQTTPLDGIAESVIRARCDRVMRGIMDRLEIRIPPFTLRRHVVVSDAPSAKTPGSRRLAVRGVDVNGNPFSFLTGAAINGGAVKTDGPLRAVVPAGKQARLRLLFMGHYNETPLDLAVVVAAADAPRTRMHHVIVWDPAASTWSCEDAFHVPNEP